MTWEVEVTGSGTAELSYLARSESGEATVEKGVTLPWKKTVQVPLGKAPTVALVLDGKGGQASCTLAIRGKHVQRATAPATSGERRAPASCRPASTASTDARSSTPAAPPTGTDRAYGTGAGRRPAAPGGPGVRGGPQTARLSA